MLFHVRTWKWIICGLIILISFPVLSALATEMENSAPALGTDDVPSNLTVSVQLDQEGKYITATFRGGKGQNLLKEIDIDVIYPDGTKVNGVLGNVIGESVVLQGSGCGDQVMATSYYLNGMRYVFLNEKMHYITGICPADYSPYIDPCSEIAASPSLKPDPIQEIPDNKSVVIQTNVDISTINVLFRGGFGQNLIKTLAVSRIGPDGSVETKDLGHAIGDEVSFSATNNCLDRIAADVSFIDGTQYHFFDEVVHISRYQ